MISCCFLHCCTTASWSCVHAATVQHGPQAAKPLRFIQGLTLGQLCLVPATGSPPQVLAATCLYELCEPITRHTVCHDSAAGLILQANGPAYNSTVTPLVFVRLLPVQRQRPEVLTGSLRQQHTHTEPKLCSSNEAPGLQARLPLPLSLPPSLPPACMQP